MPADQPPTFENLFAAIGKKLDSDSELRELICQALVLFSTRSQIAPAEESEPSEDATLEEEATIQTVDLEAPATQAPVAPPASLTDLTSLVKQFLPSPPAQPAIASTSRPGGPAPFATIKARLTIKQAAIEQAKERAEAKERGENVHSTGQWFSDLISKAKALPNCYLWMCHPRHDAVSPRIWHQMGTCFHVLSRALNLAEEVQRIEVNHSILESTLLLLAEAQSTVRTACSSFDFDADQVDIYLHLLEWSAAEQLYIGRFMKADDRADPANSQDLLRRIDKLDSEVASINAARLARTKLMGKIRYEAKMLSNHPTAAEDTWTKIINSVDQLISDGLPASNADLRSILIGHLDDLPESFDLPEGFKKFLTAADSYLANQQPEATQVELIPTAEVQKVSAFLKGAEIVIIGGDCRHESKRALIRAFGLSDLNWIETRPHETTSQFESAIARSDVKLVLLAIRWSSHSYGDVKKFCDKYDKKLVRLPRGYGVNQVAAEICNQCSEEFGY